MTTPTPLPKPGSSSFRALLDDVKRALDLPRLIVVLEGALDRKTLEDELQRVTRGSLGRAASLARPELVGRLADVFHRDGDVAAALMRHLDKACHKERFIVASIDEAALDERLAGYRALDFRRERARLVWALLRDGRAAHAAASARILDQAFAHIDEARRAEETLADPAVAPPDALVAIQERLTGYEDALREQQQQLQREVGLKEGVERDRSELLARIAARERALRDEEELRRKSEEELRRARARAVALEEQLASLDPARVANLAVDNEKLRERVRTLERAIEHVGRVDALEEELAVAARKAREDDARHARERASLEDQLRAIAVRERGALLRVDELREELRDARRQLAGPAVAPVARGTGRVGVFIDEANLSASARRDFGSRLDFAALLPALLDGRTCANAIAFVVQADDGAVGTEKHRAFAHSLRSAGYDVRDKRVKVRADGSRKADWDMGIAMEILDCLDALDVVVIGSGDGDFLPLVRRLQREGKRVEVAAFRASTEEQLLRAADEFHGLDGRFRLQR